MTDMTATSNPEYYFMIGIKLSDDQIRSIQDHKLDFEKIKNLQQAGQWPDTSSAPGWKAGNNFGSAVFVGYRKNPDTGNNDLVYLKTDGWFTTPTDLTNCNPLLNEQDEPTFTDGEGYEFGDMSAVAAKKSVVQGVKAFAESAEALSRGAQMLSADANKWTGGKTRKRKHKRKSKASRRYRK